MLFGNDVVKNPLVQAEGDLDPRKRWLVAMGVSSGCRTKKTSTSGSAWAVFLPKHMRAQAPWPPVSARSKSPEAARCGSPGHKGRVLALGQPRQEK